MRFYGDYSFDTYSTNKLFYSVKSNCNDHTVNTLLCDGNESIKTAETNDVNRLNIQSNQKPHFTIRATRIYPLGGTLMLQVRRNGGGK